METLSNSLSEQNLTLWDLKKNAKARIMGFDEKMPTAYALRLRELGFDKNVVISCERRSVLNGPRTFQLGDCVLSLESQIGLLVTVEPEE